MLTSKKSRRGVVGAVVLAGVLAVSGYALTAASTVDDSQAGYGTSTVTAQNVSQVHYVLDTTDPTMVEEVDFVLDSDFGTTILGGTAYVSVDGATSWSDACDITAYTDVKCTLSTPVAAEDIVTAEVVVAD